METDGGRRTIKERGRGHGAFERLTGVVRSVPTPDGSASSLFPGSPGLRGAMVPGGTRARAALPPWLSRLGQYALALLFVATADLLRWAWADVLRFAPALVFYLAWAGAAACGGLGPGLLAAVASWLSVELLFDRTPGHLDLNSPVTVGRLWIFLAGGLVVGGVGEMMRRMRRRERRQKLSLATLNAALGASEAKYRFLVENSKDVTWTVDLEGRWTFISRNVENVTGYRADEVRGRLIQDFLAPECRDRVQENLRRRLRGEDLPAYEVLIVGKDGQVIPFELVAASIRDDGGNVVGVQGVSRDITERKRAEAALQASERRYRGLVEKINDWAWEIDADGVYTYASPRVQGLLGYRPEEVVGRTPFDLMPASEAQRVRDAVRPIWLARQPLELLENTLVRQDGGRITVETSGVPLFAADGSFQGYAGIDRDVTSRKRAEAALHELNTTLESKVAARTAELEQRARQLQELTLELAAAEERERQRLAEILHDDLQQVLAAARFQVSLLGNRVKDDVDSRALAGQAKELLTEAIAKSRSLSHELSAPVLARNDLGEAFAWLAEQMRAKHGFTVHLEVGEQIEVTSGPLRVLLYKAAQELLFNVIKHAGVAEATLRLRHRDRRIRLAVADKGRGFDPARSGFTLGFGLLSIRERVGFLGGRLKIRSAPGKGSAFVVVVPNRVW